MTRAPRQGRQPRPKKSSRRPTHQLPKTFMQHIAELRKRLFWTALIGLIIGGVVYAYYDAVLKVIMAPLGDEKLVYLTPGGGFAFIFSATLYVTLLGVLPFFLYQIYGFLKPAIPAHVGKLSIKVALAALLLMAAGVSFGYFVAIPQGLAFLTTFASDYVIPSLTAESYLNFIFSYALGIGLLFELPLLLMLWHWISPIPPKKLLNSERYVIVVAFILAAILSPTPDAINQTMIAVPIIVVYQFGVIGVLLSIRRGKKRAKKAAARAREEGMLASDLTSPLPQPVPVVSVSTVQPARQAHPASAPTSIDGFRIQSHAPRSRAERPSRGTVVVPSRQPRHTGLISDFGPIHRSAIDTGR